MTEATEVMQAVELKPCPFCGGAATCENIGDREDFWMAG